MQDQEMQSQLEMVMSSKEWPVLNEWLLDEELAKLSLTINEDISWFAGHFPEQAVLPGVVQIHWATQLSKILFAKEGATLSFRAANNVKFKTMILPGQTLELHIKFNRDKNSVAFSYQKQEEQFSTGTLVFAL